MKPLALAIGFPSGGATRGNRPLCGQFFGGLSVQGLVALFLNGLFF